MEAMTYHDLKAWRERMSFTKEGAARLLGLDFETYQRYERGEGYVRVLPRSVTAAVFGVTQAKFIADRLLSDAVFPKEGPTWKRGPMERMARWTIVDQLLDKGKLTNPNEDNISTQQHRGLVVQFNSQEATPGSQAPSVIEPSG
jgi:hypothetical protein